MREGFFSGVLFGRGLVEKMSCRWRRCDASNAPWPQECSAVSQLGAAGLEDAACRDLHNGLGERKGAALLDMATLRSLMEGQPDPAVVGGVVKWLSGVSGVNAQKWSWVQVDVSAFRGRVVFV